VHAMTVFDDGRGDALYIGGIISSAGGTNAARIVRYDGHGGPGSFEALGSGLGSNPPVSDHVLSLCPFGSKLYAGGWFTMAGGQSANYIASWDGSSWSPLSTGMFAPGGGAGVVDALVVHDDGLGPDLYAGGFFTNAGGVLVNRIARWDGTAWSAVNPGPSPGMNARVLALASYNGKLYAGGEFTTAGGVAASRIAMWDGSSWAPLGTGVSGKVLAMHVFDGKLIVGGEFATAGGLTVNQIAAWDGSTWSALGAGTGTAHPGGPTRVMALETYNDGQGVALYAGGDFTLAGGIEANHLARWSGSSWSAVGAGTTAGVTSLAVLDVGSGPKLYLGGAFFNANGIFVRSLASYDGVAFEALEPNDGVNGTILALEKGNDGHGPAIFAGGEFEQAGTANARFIAKFQNGRWHPLGTGVEDENDDDDLAVWALEIFDDGNGPALYAAGNFIVMGGVTANRIARWDGARWHPLSSGANGEVFALKVYDDGNGPALYAGGVFTRAGGVTGTNRIAKWNGQQWSTVGGGTAGGSIWALEVYDDGSGEALYAGGNFGISGNPAQNIARWDGAQWSDLDVGVSGGGFPFVYALAVHDDGSGPALYAGGRFTMAGSASLLVNRVARWNGSAWSALGTGMGGNSSPYVYGLASFQEKNGPVLLATGEFTTAGGVSANKLARWDGSSWSQFGGGITLGGFGYALLAPPSPSPTLWLGGSILSVGGILSDNIARWASQ
jgi:hypothetical protein